MSKPYALSTAANSQTGIELSPIASPTLPPVGLSLSPRPRASRSNKSSRRNSLSSIRTTAANNPNYALTLDMMVRWIHTHQRNVEWLDQTNPTPQGVLLRSAGDEYISSPPDLAQTALGHACSELNVRCAMTVNSNIIQTYLTIQPNAHSIPLANGLHLQILNSLDDLATARKHQFAAYIISINLLLVWDDNPMELVNRGRKIEADLMQILWREEAGDMFDFAGGSQKAKEANVSVISIGEGSEEAQTEAPRKRLLQHTIMCAASLCLIVMVLGSSARSLAVQIAMDKNYTRLALLCISPLQVFFTMFFMQVIVSAVAQLIGPVKQMHENSKFYSAKLPVRVKSNLPHVTWQCPVYKEGLKSVIEPTIKSLKAAISTYEMQGGTANIFVNDDGMQLLSEDEQHQRMEFYADQGIGWTARPGHGSDGFVRRGRFKKASNMNYGLTLSNKLEEKLALVQRDEKWNQAKELAEYDRCIDELAEENPRAWMEGNIRIGDYIMIIDSDTRVPTDCMLDAVSEMENSPEVGIIQFSSGVMQVVHTYFENGITFFTNLIYTAIRYGVSCGDVAPFVGHNAILRWSAVQQVSFIDPEDPVDEKFWSESHVSEDFDMALRLQILGYTVRLAAWAGEGFKEGVSLTVYDELMRWEKYAYGCSELVFHPLRTWLWRGPFTPLFRRFVSSSMPLPSKISLVAYIGTYYAIGSAWLLTFANYFIVGWIGIYGYLDKFYLDSWQVWISIVVVFNGVGCISLAALRYRSGAKGFLPSLWENLRNSLLLFVFFSGLSLHVSQALLAHMFEINMNWGATAKEAEFSNFFLEVPKILKKFRISMIFCVTGIAGLVVLSGVVKAIPQDYQINQAIAIVPMAIMLGGHLLLPIILNPALMTFTW